MPGIPLERVLAEGPFIAVAKFLRNIGITYPNLILIKITGNIFVIQISVCVYDRRFVIPFFQSLKNDIKLFPYKVS